MSFDLDGRRREENRARINNLTNFGLESNKRDEFHVPCYSSGRARLVPSKDKDKLICPNCGMLFDVGQIQKEQDKKSYKTKYPAQKNTIIITKKDQKKKAAGLSQEDLEDIARAFGSSEGATVVDESTTYTDQGGRY